MTENQEKIKENIKKNRKCITSADLEKLEYAAKSGDTEAAYVLGAFYIQGNDTVAHNDKLFLRWMKFSADGGYAPAMFNLFNLYNAKYSDFPVENNPQKALEWLQKSANAGFVLALRELGNCYHDGYLVKKDWEKAYDCYYQAMGEGDIPSIIVMAEMLEGGSDEMEENPKGAFCLYKIAAEAGNDAYAQSIVGDKYFHGDGVEKDWKQALHWLMQAAEEGDALAQYHAGIMHFNGDGTEQNTKKALDWLSRSQKNGYEHAEAAIKKIESSMSTKQKSLLLKITELWK
jgi:TPR repeat protein